MKTVLLGNMAYCNSSFQQIHIQKRSFLVCFCSSRNTQVVLVTSNWIGPTNLTARMNDPVVCCYTSGINITRMVPEGVPVLVCLATSITGVRPIIRVS